MKIILIETDEKLRNIFSLNLSSELNLDIVLRDNGVEACAMIDLLEEELVIVTVDKVGNENTAKRIIDHISNTPQNCPLHIFVLGEIESDFNFVHQLSASTTSEKLTREVCSALNKSAIKSNLKEEEAKVIIDKGKYFAIPISILNYSAKAPCALYLKVTHQNSTEYIKRYNLNDYYEQSEIMQYEDKGAHYFYVQEKDRQMAVEYYNSRFLDILNQNFSNTATRDDIQTYILEQLSNVGMNSTAARVANETVSSIIDKIDEAPRVNGLLAKMYKSPGSFQYRNSFTIAVLTSAILKRQDWADQRHKEYLVLAAFLHDMEIEETNHQLILTEHELNTFVFPPAVTTHIRTHAKLAAEKIHANPDIPSEVTKIIKQHHGVLTGIGFTNTLPKQISPLVKIFITAEEFSQRLLGHPRKKIIIPELIRDIKSKFQDGSLDECLEDLSLVFES